MPVEFLSDEQVAGYAAYRGVPSRTELERFFFLDDTDRELVEARRRDHNRLGFAVQLCTVRFLGRFMADPRQVPVGVAEYLAGQLGITDVSCLKAYGERDGTARTHAGEIGAAGGWRDFPEACSELGVWMDARAWTTGDGPKSLFDASVAWLRERRVLLPASGVDLSVALHRRPAEVARYGMEAKATLLNRHPPTRRAATMLATVCHLGTLAVDDALDLLDVLITSRLLARPEAQRPLPEADQRTTTTGQRPTETVRVDTDRLDQLMDLAGQLVINKAQFSQIGGRLKAVVDCNQAVRALDKLSGELDKLGSGGTLRIDGQHLAAELESVRGQVRRIRNDLEPIRREVQTLSRARDSVRELFEAIHQLDRVSDGIQKGVMDIRMVPIGPLFARFHRVVRDISRASGKQIRLEIAARRPSWTSG